MSRNRPRQTVFTTDINQTDLQQLIVSHSNLASYQWLQTAMRYFGTTEIAGGLSDPLIVQFIATTTGLTYHAQNRQGTFMEVNTNSRLPLVCSMGFNFTHTNRRGREVRLDEEVTHWCSAFVNHVMITSGFDGTHSLAARSWRRWGLPISRQDIDNYFGAITVFSRPSEDNPNAGHVGFYVGQTRHSYLILGGNQHNSVCVKKYSKERLLAFRWPS